MCFKKVPNDPYSFCLELLQDRCTCYQKRGTVNRGGASEASEATLTDYVDGARDISVRQALGLITPRACAKGAESAIFEIHFYRERKLWEKKDLLLWSGLEPGSDALQTTAFATEPMGALVALDCKFGSYTVDCCSELQ